jgi:signal transduction histidine kinase
VAARTQELRDALGRLQAFTYSMVHDMRAPLRAIRGFGTILEMEADPAARREYARRVCESADRLDQLITDLQSYSDTATKPVQIVPVEVERLVDEVLEQYPKLVEARAHIQVHRPMPRVCGNAALLALSLAHLLENALKFIPPGRTPNVEVSCERRERMVRIWVVDNGVGIAPEYHERIFGLFQQLKGPAAGKGTGVGLAIARRAVEKMGGTIGLESTPGKGSRFWVELPAATLLSPPCDCRMSRATQEDDPMQTVQFTPVE